MKFYIEGISELDFNTLMSEFERSETPSLSALGDMLNLQRGAFTQSTDRTDQRKILVRFGPNPDSRRHLLERLIFALIREPGATPSSDEYWMSHAWTAAERSSSIRAKVGASLVFNNSLIAVGTNEVPVRAGGLPWPSSNPDPRDFATVSYAHPSRRDAVWNSLISVLRNNTVSEAQIDALTDSAAALQIMELIDVERAVHAEIAVVADAAMRGVAVRDTVLYTTHRPCYRCERFLAVSGVRKVVFDLDNFDSSIAVSLRRELTSPLSVERFEGIRWGELESVLRANA